MHIRYQHNAHFLLLELTGIFKNITKHIIGIILLTGSNCSADQCAGDSFCNFIGRQVEYFTAG